MSLIILICLVLYFIWFILLFVFGVWLIDKLVVDFVVVGKCLK